MVPTPETPTSKSPAPFRLWIGIGIIVFGVLAALDNLGFIHHAFFIKLWPLVLVALGLSRLGSNRGERGMSSSLFILAGVFLLVVNFGGESLTEAIWPLFIVALGIYIVIRSLRRHRGAPPALASHEGFLATTAIFGATKRHPVTHDFKGGEMTAIFGGFEIDLRQCGIDPDPARIDLFVLFGGGEIRVPQGWVIDNKASAIFGGFEDKTLHLPADPLNPVARPTLVLTGMALFGGLTVSN